MFLLGFFFLGGGLRGWGWRSLKCFDFRGGGGWGSKRKTMSI